MEIVEKKETNADSIRNMSDDMTESEAIEQLKHSIVSYEVQNRDNITCDLTREVLNMAINSLEKQIPNKPKERDCIGFNTLVCPVCKGALYLYEPYCDNCGQKLDWSDEE